MSRWVRVVSWVGGLVALVLVVGFAVVGWNIRRSFPQTDGTVSVPGLGHDVRVVRDAWGIPQIYASTSADLFYAQGYVQAQDRFFQMDFDRHVTAGTLTELFGRSALKTDIFVRTLGWRHVAEQELALLSPDARGYLESFSAGVNAYLRTHSGSSLSLEYAALGLNGLDYTPAAWTPTDSLAWLKAMAWDLGSNMNDEVARALDTATLDPHQIRQLYPAYPYAQNQPIVTQGAVVDGVYEQNATSAGSRLPSRPPFFAAAATALRSAGSGSQGLDRILGTGTGVGSNAWAVSGRHTASGAPIIANDPHLSPSMPGTWYQMGLHCIQVSPVCPFDVSGFTFPGLPGVVIGHNANIAWGFSNMYADVQDLYLERVVPGNKYLYNGRLRKLHTRRETFKIAGQSEPVTITVRVCNHGPLISDVSAGLSTVGADAPTPRGSPPRGHGYAVALSWTALKPGRTAEAVFALDRAASWNQFRDAARKLEVPSQNLVYADVHGNIGYQAPGDIPIRQSGNGRWPMPGWDPAYDWNQKFIPFNALPSVLNPKDGYVVTANQAVTRPNYPYLIGTAFDYGYRSQRIRDLLESTPKLTVADMARFQLDTFSVLAKRLTPLLLSIPLPSTYLRQGQKVLRHWNDQMNPNSPGATYFNVVWSNLLALTFRDQLPARTWPNGDSRWWTVMLHLVREPHNVFWDNVHTDRVETRDDIVREALVHARQEITRTLSRDPHDWHWGALHQLTLRNRSLGSAGSPVAFLFNRGSWALGGGSSTVDATSWDASKGYAVDQAPSMRMVIPLDNLDGARWIDLTGESGHAYNSHYTDQTTLWAAGKTVPWAFTTAAVQRGAAQTLTLVPNADCPTSARRPIVRRPRVHVSRASPAEHGSG